MEREEAMKILKDFHDKSALFSVRTALDTIIPELKESEDEKIRKELIYYFKENNAALAFRGISNESVLAWLEKQGEQPKKHDVCDNCDQQGSCVSPCPMKLVEKQDEQKPADETKFKVGDWVVYCNDDVDLITGIEENGYCINNGGYIPFVCESDIRLWTIQDAKAGDVLADGNLPFIFKKIDTNNYSYAYCGISVDDSFKIESDGESGEWTWMQDIKPATKEQRYTLIKAMDDAGYTFDFDKKELKKIEQKPTEIVKWSPQEESCICQLESLVKEQWRQAEKVHNSVNIKKMSELMFFLKTLNPNKKPQRIISAEAKEAMYDKPAWSEEDEERFQSCIKILQSSDGYDTINTK